MRCQFFQILFLLLAPSILMAQVCFTPGHPCERLLVKFIYQAQHTIRMQSYTFTSYRIAHALAAAHHRGVDVQVILDKSQFQCQHFSQRRYLQQHGVIVYEDYKPNIAHNKVIIIDDHLVETGSFNYTRSAQKYNAENVLILDDKGLAQQYLKNWQQRRQQSVRVTSSHCTNDLLNQPVPN